MPRAELIAALEDGRDDIDLWLAAAELIADKRKRYVATRCLLRAARHPDDNTIVDHEALMPVAMMLVPKTWTAWELRSSAGKTHFSADLSRVSECDAGEDWRHGSAKYPAAALLLAALKARETR